MDLQLSGQALAIANGDLVLVDGLAAIAQDVTTRLQFFLGEWFLNTSAGIPYFQKILVKNPNLAVVGSLLRKTILTTPGIKTLTEDLSFVFTGATRTMSVSFTADTISGPLTYTKDLVL